MRLLYFDTLGFSFILIKNCSNIFKNKLIKSNNSKIKTVNKLLFLEKYFVLSKNEGDAESHNHYYHNVVLALNIFI